MRNLMFAAAAVAALACAPATATNIDFNALHKANGDYNYVTGPYHEDGYTLNAALCQGTKKDGCFVSVQSFQSIDPAGAALITQYQSQKVTVTKDDGAYFTFGSIDFSEYWDNGSYPASPIAIAFSWINSDGTAGAANRTIGVDGRYVPTTLTFNTGPLQSFSWTPVGAVQFDNIIVNAAAVPEPATWAMMIGGFGMVGGAMRRRRSGTAAFA